MAKQLFVSSEPYYILTKYFRLRYRWPKHQRST